MLPVDLPKTITAVGGLGTAAFGVVDAIKPLVKSINRIGLAGINATIAPLIPGAPPQQKIPETLEANWINGTDLASQKAIAKSLIKLNLNADNAGKLADAIGLSGTKAASFKEAADKVAQGNAAKPLSADETDAFQRFDFAVTALLDEAYQRSDQVYRNYTRFLAMLVAVVLALAGGWMLHDVKDVEPWYSFKNLAESLVVGLLATPLAPIAKDLSTALATAVDTLQLVKK